MSIQLMLYILMYTIYIIYTLYIIHYIYTLYNIYLIYTICLYIIEQARQSPAFVEFVIGINI